jgi:hypothetical protein
VPTFTCGFVLSNFAFAMLSASCWEVKIEYVVIGTYFAFTVSPFTFAIICSEMFLGTSS